MRRHVKRIHDPEREQKLAEKRRLRAEQRARKKPIKRESSVERDYRTGRFMCDCGRGYLEKGNLRRHQHKNHGKPLKRYVVVLCSNEDELCPLQTGQEAHSAGGAQKETDI